MKQKLFPFTRKTAHRIVKKAFPNLYPNYFRMNRIANLGGYTEASKQLGLAQGRRVYSKEWNQIARKRISEFGRTCPITGESDKLHVHHIDYDSSNNESENLIPLWVPYHKLIHARAGFSQFYKALDMTVLLSISKAWCK